MCRESPTTDWGKIALLLPYEDIVKQSSAEQIEKLEKLAQAYIPVFARFFDKEFDKKRGVSTRLLKGMVVDHKRPTNRYPVNSTGWNNCANGMSFIVRLLNVISFLKKDHHSGFLPISFLTAHDQFREFILMGKRLKPYALIWCFITSMHRPWRKVPFEELDQLFSLAYSRVIEQGYGQDDDEATKPVSPVELLEDAGDAGDAGDADVESLYHRVELRRRMFNSFFGVMSQKVSKTKQHVDMICGCSVDGVDKALYDFLRVIGLFGATPWKGSQ
jgi:hypothetical protein